MRWCQVNESLWGTLSRLVTLTSESSRNTAEGFVVSDLGLASVEILHSFFCLYKNDPLPKIPRARLLLVSSTCGKIILWSWVSVTVEMFTCFEYDGDPECGASPYRLFPLTVAQWVGRLDSKPLVELNIHRTFHFFNCLTPFLNVMD